MLNWTMCYEIITPESAEHGDAAENGYYQNGGWQHPIKTVDWERDKDALTTFGTVTELIRQAQDLGCQAHPDADWLYSIDPDPDYRTGENTYYSIHFTGVTDATRNRIEKLLG